MKAKYYKPRVPTKPVPIERGRPFRRFWWKRSALHDGNVVEWVLSRRLGPHILSLTVFVSRYDIDVVGPRIAAEQLREARTKLKALTA